MTTITGSIKYELDLKYNLTSEATKSISSYSAQLKTGADQVASQLSDVTQQFNTFLDSVTSAQNTASSNTNTVLA